MSYQSPQPTPTPQAAPPAPTPAPDDVMSLEEVIDEVEKSSGLPKGFLRALRDNESKGGHYDEAHGGRVITSPTGPRGVFQFSRRTARQYGINPDDPTENVIGAAKYAKDNYTALKKLLPNDDEAWAAAALAHNRGLGAVQGMIRNGSLEPKGSDGYTDSDTYASSFLDNWMKYRGEQTQQNITEPIAPNRQRDADLSPQQNLAQPQGIGARAGQTVGRQITPTRTEVTSKILSPEDEEKALADIHPERPNLQPYDPEKGLSLPAKLARRSAESSGESLPEQMARSSVAKPSGILETVTASVPDNASPSDVVDALLDKLGPQWKALNEKYRRETGRDLMSVRNIPQPTKVWVDEGYDPKLKNQSGHWENQVAMNPTEEFIAVAQAYAEGGVEAAQAKESEFIAKGKEDTKKQKMAVEAARETMQRFGVDPDVAADLQTGIMKTGQGTAQLMENLRKVHEGEDPTIEDKNQQVINQSRAAVPAYKTNVGAVGGTALEVAGVVSRMQLFPYGALVEQFSENINRGGWEAAKSAGTIAALQGMGIGADKLSLLAELSPAARQVFVRAVQGDTNAALAAAQGEKGKELLKAFGIGAAFPVGSGERAEREPIAPRIAPTERTARISRLDMPDIPVRTIEGVRAVKPVESETPTQASQMQSKPIVEAAAEPTPVQKYKVGDKVVITDPQTDVEYEGTVEKVSSRYGVQRGHVRIGEHNVAKVELSDTDIVRPLTAENPARVERDTFEELKAAAIRVVERGQEGALKLKADATPEDVQVFKDIAAEHEQAVKGDMFATQAAQDIFDFAKEIDNEATEASDSTANQSPSRSRAAKLGGETGIRETPEVALSESGAEAEAASARNRQLEVGDVSDRELGGIYRDWVAMRDPRESAYPSEESLQKYAGWARRILAGEKNVSLEPNEEFARFVRVRREAKRQGLDLRAAFDAYKNGQDFPVSESGEPKLTPIAAASEESKRATPPLQGTEAQAEVHHSQLQPRTEAGEFREETATERDDRRAQMAEGVKVEPLTPRITGAKEGERGALNLGRRRYEEATTPVLKEVEHITQAEPVKARSPLRTVERVQTSLTSQFTPLRSLEARLYGDKKIQGVDLARKFEQVAGAPAKAQADVIEFRQSVVDPIRQNADDFNSYLFLKRVEDRLTNDPETKRVATWTPEKAQEGLKELQSKVGDETFAKFEEAGKAYQAEMRKALRLQVDSGRMSEDLYEQIVNSSDFYAPFKVLRYIEQADALPAGTGRRIATTQALTKKITGIDSEDFQVGNLLQASAEQIVRSRILAEKNLKMLELDSLADLDPDGKLIKRVEAGTHPRRGYELVRYFKDGKESVLEVERPVTQAIQGLNAQETGLLAKAASLTRQPLRWGATSANAGFQAVNLFFADLPRAAILSKYGVRSLRDVYQFPMDWAYSLFTSMKGNFGRPNDLFIDWLKSGAANSTIQREITPEAFRETLGFGRPSVRRIPKGVLDSLAKFSNAIEETSKILGIRRGMRIEGVANLPPTEAKAAIDRLVTEVRNYSGSPDFARSGKDTKSLNLLFMFFNARLQGMSADLSRLAGRTGGREASSAWLRMGTAVGLPTTLLALVNMSPKLRDDYDKIPEWERRNYWMIPRSSKFKNEDTGEEVRDYWRIPKRDVFQLFANTIESAVRFGYDHDPKEAGEFATNTLEDLSPVNVQGENATERMESVFGSMNPLIKLPAEVATNRDFFRHRDITPEFMRKAKPEEQYRPSTNEAFVRGGKALGVSPLTLEHVASGASGGALSQFTIRAPQGGRSPITEYPLFKRFVRSGQTAEDKGRGERLKQAETEDATQTVVRSREAIKLLSSWRGLSDAEVERRIGQVADRDDRLAQKISEVREEMQKGLTALDKRIRDLGVESGARQRFIDSELQHLTPEERTAWLAELERKDLIPKGRRPRGMPAPPKPPPPPRH